MSEKISPHIRQTEERVRKLCEGCADIVIRSMFLGKENRVECLVVYIEAAVSNMMLEDSVRRQHPGNGRGERAGNIRHERAGFHGGSYGRHAGRECGSLSGRV